MQSKKGKPVIKAAKKNKVADVEEDDDEESEEEDNEDPDVEDEAGSEKNDEDSSGDDDPDVKIVVRKIKKGLCLKLVTLASDDVQFCQVLGSKCKPKYPKDVARHVKNHATMKEMLKKVAPPSESHGRRRTQKVAQDSYHHTG